MIIKRWSIKGIQMIQLNKNVRAALKRIKELAKKRSAEEDEF